VFDAATEYWRDAAQRGVLFMETLNERGNTYVAQSAKTAPHVLTFPVEILRDGRSGRTRSGPADRFDSGLSAPSR
jgi:hypothetical protein